MILDICDYNFNPETEEKTVNQTKYKFHKFFWYIIKNKLL